MDLVEKFISINGEPPIQGEPTLFYRFSYCNLNCKYCDTKYFNEVNLSISAEELEKDIVLELKKRPFLKILFTGGEPFLGTRQEKLLSVIKKLDKYQFYIETNGTVKINDFSIENAHFIIDWKSPSSNSSLQFNVDNLYNARDNKDVIKFVVERSDFSWLSKKINFVRMVNASIPVYIVPQWNNIKLKEIADFILKNGYNVNMGFQLHKYIWQSNTRGV